ncbi:MAG TPA: DMT family transporter [Alphaproteobacteria bacterium]
MHDKTVTGRNATALPLALLLVLGANWGLGFALAKLGMTGGLAPLAYAYWQCTGAGLVLLAICAARGELPPLDWRHVRYYLIAGATNIAAPNTVAFTTVRHIPVGIVVLMVTMTPLLAYGFAQLFGLERFDRHRALGIALGFLGTLLILVPRTSLPSPDMAGWVLFAVLTPTFYAGSNLYIGWARPADVPSLALGAAMQLAAGFVLLPLALASGSFHVPLPPFTTGELANLGHVAVAAIGALLFFEIIRMAGAVFVSQVGYVVCLSGVFWGYVIFDERHSLWIWAAMASILGGLVLVTRPRAARAC